MKTVFLTVTTDSFASSALKFGIFSMFSNRVPFGKATGSEKSGCLLLFYFLENRIPVRNDVENV